ncbi:type II toxin-antitoxin system VapC family toxin [Candidatus Woesearchaeota archaeon]|nr:type II toxin-antitoxin system VapC family toxin [Candidatus Woesearchaeota archaeon]
MERKKSNLIGNYVLDSSVIIKWFCEEEDTDLALQFREGFLKGSVDIIVPDLQLYEIANALRYNKKLKSADVSSAVNSLIDIGINIVVPTKDVISSALALAYQFDITLYDAYFIALAKELNYDFVTADDNLFDKIKKLKFVKLLSNFR